MEPIPLKIDATLLGGKLWTLRTAVERRWRFSPQSMSANRYADITLRAEPYSGPENVVFVNAIASDNDLWEFNREPEEAAFVHTCIEGVIEGLTLALRRSAEEGFPLKSLMVTLVELRIHPIDSSPDTCRFVAQELLRGCLEHNSLVVYEEA